MNALTSIGVTAIAMYQVKTYVHVEVLLLISRLED